MDDGANDGSTTFTVTCNGLGTAWISGGVPVNSVECSVGKYARVIIYLVLSKNCRIQKSKE